MIYRYHHRKVFGKVCLSANIFQQFPVFSCLQTINELKEKWTNKRATWCLLVMLLAKLAPEGNRLPLIVMALGAAAASVCVWHQELRLLCISRGSVTCQASLMCLLILEGGSRPPLELVEERVGALLFWGISFYALLRLKMKLCVCLSGLWLRHQQLFSCLFSQLQVSANFWPFPQFLTSPSRDDRKDWESFGWGGLGGNGTQLQRVWILFSAVNQFKFLGGKEAGEVAARVSSAVSWSSALWLSGRLLSSSDVGGNNSMFSWCAAVASQNLSFWLMFTSRCLQTGAFIVGNAL